MSYLYALVDTNYEDFSSGRVLYNQQGATAFPVRLISEIFLRCEDYLKKSGNHGPYKIYDPLCGGAFSLTTLGFLYGRRISSLIASDLDGNVIGLAKKNLSLVTREGLQERYDQISKLLDEFGKESHRDALKSIDTLRDLLETISQPIKTQCFTADILKPLDYPISEKVDIVISDLPYGEVVDWTKEGSEEEAIEQLLSNLLPVLGSNAIVAITARKKTKIRHRQYIRVDHFIVGKRQTILLKPNTQDVLTTPD